MSLIKSSTKEEEWVMAKARPKIAKVSGDIVDLLEPFTSEERHRAINAALTLLGEAGRRQQDKTTQDRHVDDKDSAIDLRPKAKTWIKQNQITDAQLEQMFHISGNDVDFIGTVPGKSDVVKTTNAYVLAGKRIRFVEMDRVQQSISVPEGSARSASQIETD
jgi:hypothetical protein